VSDADTLIVENAECFGAPIAELQRRAGRLPACRGRLAREQGWEEG
jgi:hypothetical protein